MPIIMEKTKKWEAKKETDRRTDSQRHVYRIYSEGHNELFLLDVAVNDFKIPF